MATSTLTQIHLVDAYAALIEIYQHSRLPDDQAEWADIRWRCKRAATELLVRGLNRPVEIKEEGK